MRSAEGAHNNAVSMMPALLTNKDIWGGAMLIAIGAAALVIARDYPFGTALRMGPGYFPSVLGAALCLFGLYLVARGVRSSETISGDWSLRALVVVTLSLVLFGVLIDRAGFIPALVVLIVGASAAGKEFRWAEVVLLAIGLTLFCVAVFIWGLGLPYPLLAGF
jgi:putative tricarboxylic transport membrane protein